MSEYLYATAISIAYFGCLRAGEVSYPSTHSFHPKQHLTIKEIIIHQNTVQLRLKSSKRDQFRRGCHYHYRTKQTKHLSSADHKAVPTPQEARTLIRCNIRLKDGSLLTRPRLQAMICNTLHSLKLPAELFGTHSLCIRSATTAAEAGIPMKIIKAMVK